MTATDTAQHTPGPWAAIEQRGTALSFGRQYCITLGPGRVGLLADVYGPNGVESEATHSPMANANARLIAAAPDLLEALENLVDATSRFRWPDDIDKRSFITAARAAIAKAIA